MEFPIFLQTDSLPIIKSVTTRDHCEDMILCGIKLLLVVYSFKKANLYCCYYHF